MMAARDPFDWMSPGGIGGQDPEDVMKANEAMADAAQLQMIEDAKLYFEVFNTGRGPELLALLRECTIELPLIRMTGSFGGGEIAMTGAEWAYFREGQNSVIRMIEAQMKIAVQPANSPANAEGNGNG